MRRIAALDATAKSPKNGTKTIPTLQNQMGKGLLTLASHLAKMLQNPEQWYHSGAGAWQGYDGPLKIDFDTYPIA